VTLGGEVGRGQQHGRELRKARAVELAMEGLADLELKEGGTVGADLVVDACAYHIKCTRHSQKCVHRYDGECGRVRALCASRGAVHVSRKKMSSVA
jgi:hypothetical protein